MSKDINPEEPEVKEQPEAEERQEPEAQPLVEATPDELMAEIKRLRNEAKKYRTERNEYQSKTSEYEQKQKELEEKKALEEGKHVEVITNLKKENATLKEKADAYNEYIESRRQVIKDELGDDWEEDFSTLPLTTLEKVAKKLGSKTAASMDNGTGKHAVSDLTEEEKQEAISMGLSEEAYKRYKATRTKIKK